jgi:hypothetical protein
MDFVLDDVFGPSLRLSEGTENRASTPIFSVIKEDAGSTIQETSQNSQPARMVGEADLESHDPSGMDAAREETERYTRYEGTG